MGANWWEVLGCSADATPGEVRERFRTLAQLYHPDRWMDAPDAVRSEAAERMLQLTDAYEASKTRRSANPRPGPPPRPEPRSSPSTRGAAPDRSWSAPGAGRGYRHPRGADWVRNMEAKGRVRWVSLGSHPSAALAACRRYVEGRRGWKVTSFDADDGVLTFTGRVGIRTWQGQTVTVWVEPAAQVDTWYLIAVADSPNPQIFEWNEAPAVLSELVERAGLRTIGRY